MNPQPFDEEAVFNEARRIQDSAARAEFLKRACPDESSVARIDALLRMHAHDDSFLNAPPAELTDPTEIKEHFAEQPGTVIGPYKLLQQIGEGGMGAVYLAEQSAPVERQVALKIIKPGMDSQQVIGRFEAERQALAMMDHPNIAKVLDAGTTPTGRPYFVMELVKGIPVTQFCDEQHLAPRERLELFVPICQAVQHAHQKGIIHRDLKPSNILIAQYDDKPVPKVIDFGVAKAISQKLTEKTMFTQYGQVVGTLEYMSPEQARFNQLDVDTRSDVYSLGVLLYELLTGETPFDKQRLKSAAFDELLRIIREEEPPRPSVKLSGSQTLPSIAANRRIEPHRLTGLVRGELDWIVMKAMEKDRSRRYESASRFAEDVQHYLNNEAVTACPPSVSYRFRKMFRRNKALIGTTAAIGLSLIVGTGVAIWQAYEAIEQRDRAVLAERNAEAAKIGAKAEARRATDEAERANQEAARADAEAEKAKQNAEVANAVNQFLNDDLLGMARAGSQIRAGLEPDPNIRLLSVVERAAQQIEGQFPDKPLVEASLRSTIGEVFFRLGKPQSAVPHVRRATELLRQVRGENHAETLGAKSFLGILLSEIGQSSEGEQLIREALQAQKQLFGIESKTTLTSVSYLANTISAQGRKEEALKLYQELLELEQTHLGEEHPNALITMHNVADLLLQLQRSDDAEYLYSETVRLQKQKFGEEHPATLSSMNGLANSIARKNAIEAEKINRHVLDVKHRVFGPRHPSTLLSMEYLARSLRFTNKLAEREKLQREILQIRRQTLAPEDPLIISALHNLAVTLRLQHRFEEANELYQQELEILTRIYGRDHPQTRKALRALSNSHANESWSLSTSVNADRRDSKSALLHARKSIELAADVANNWDNLGVALLRNKHYQEAIDAFEKAREMRGGEDPEHRFFLAMAHWGHGNPDSALAEYAHAGIWLNEHRDWGEQQRFRDEAEQWIGFDRIRHFFQTQIAQSTDDFPTHVALIDLLIRHDRNQEAEQELVNLLTTGSSQPDQQFQINRAVTRAEDVFFRTINLRPQEKALWEARGNFLALKKRWKSAAEAYEKSGNRQYLAATLLLSGDHASYRRCCLQATDSLPDKNALKPSRDRAILELMAYSDEAQFDRGVLVKLAESLVDQEPREFTLHTLGCTHYRAGEFDAALEVLLQSNEMSSRKTAMNAFPIALAYYHLGDKATARQWYVSGENAMKQEQPTSLSSTSESIENWLCASIWRREADRVLTSYPSQQMATQQSQPENTWIHRMKYLIRRERWKEAYRAYKSIRPEDLSDIPIDEQRKAVQLMLLVEEYEEAADLFESLVARQQPDSKESNAFPMAKIAGLFAESPIDRERVLRWAESAVKKKETAWHYFALALARYRNHEYERSIEVARTANAKQWHEPAKAQNFLVMALAEHRLGRDELARKALAEARSRLASISQLHRSQLLIHEGDILTVALLLREAVREIEESETTLEAVRN